MVIELDLVVRPRLLFRGNMSEEIKEYFQKIGRKGGENSKRTDMKGANSPGQIAAQEGRVRARKKRKEDLEQKIGSHVA